MDPLSMSARVLCTAGLFYFGGLSGVALADASMPPAVPAFPVQHGPWTVGYHTELTHDPGRSFGTRTEPDGTVYADLRSRPVLVHCWYPGVDQTGSAMRYGDYLMAAASTPVGSSAGEQETFAAYKARPLARGADEGRLDALLAAPTGARRDAEPERRPFPLIVYAPSINAEPFENAGLFEYLASHGFVVASSACLGWNEGEVSRDRQGALTQLGDVEHVLRIASAEPFVDTDHVGLLGFSWGGTSVLLLALRHAGIDAVVTLDGGYGFPQYRSVAEADPWWVPRNLRAAFLQITPLQEERDSSFAAASLYADTWGWRMTGFEHRDFASDAVLALRWAAGDPATEEHLAAHAALQTAVLSFFRAHLSADAAAEADLRLAASRAPGTVWTQRAALPTPPTAAQFDEIIATEGVDAAVARFHEARQADPGVVIFGEERLLRYATEWGPERAEEVWKLLEINAEAWPGSADTHFWMAQVQMTRNNRTAACEELETALRLDPGHERARRLLERLTSAGH